jgi:hypothetical protein
MIFEVQKHILKVIMGLEKLKIELTYDPLIPLLGI